ncbi:MAG TPA: Hsp20/alpha crystallin family protein [Pyrinomonadaceae bacterium]
MSTVREEKVQTNGSKELPTESALLTKGEETAPERRPTFFLSPWEDNPFAFMRRFAGDMERFFEDFGSFRVMPLLRRDLWPRVGEFGRAGWSPEVEIFERDGQFTVRADLPGVTKDGVKVEVAGAALTISGERKDEKEEKGEGFYRSERTYGSFFRRIPLPEGVKADEASATFKNGVLEVTMPAPKREPQGRTLEIKEETEAKAAAK